MKSIIRILGGIGFLVFAVCSILLATLSLWSFMTIPSLLSMIIGITMVIAVFLQKKINNILIYFIYINNVHLFIYYCNFEII